MAFVDNTDVTKKKTFSWALPLIETGRKIWTNMVLFKENIDYCY